MLTEQMTGEGGRWLTLRITNAAGIGRIEWADTDAAPGAWLDLRNCYATAGLVEVAALVVEVQRQMRLLRIEGHPAQTAPGDVLTVPQAAELLGISRQAMWGKVATNRIKAEKNESGDYRISRSELARFVREGK